jgi:xanthine dehydrogenase accessory factor
VTPGSWEILEKAHELVDGGEAIALATVVWRQGPSSGQQGSRAVVTTRGEVHGWIGGACAEPVVIREAQRVIATREPRLLFIGDVDEAGLHLPDGMVHIAMSCQSEGALQVYIEPMLPTMRLVVVGHSPMAQTLGDLAAVLGWASQVVDLAEFADVVLTAGSVVVVATQGNGDEEAIEQALRADPAFVGMVASRKRGTALLEQLAERGLPPELLARVHTPVGVDLGHTTHQEIAVSVLAELVKLRAEGALRGRAPSLPVADLAVAGVTEATEAIDPVCGMTVTPDDRHHPLEVEGTTYWFCCRGCHDTFAARANETKDTVTA